MSLKIKGGFKDLPTIKNLHERSKARTKLEISGELSSKNSPKSSLK
jgi:hypothetical protein